MPLLVILSVSLLFLIYTVLAEWHWGQTLGKSLGMRAVRESGARVSIGQAVVRHLPVILQVFWIDAFFALFTEKHQRAFEMLSKTRVVLGVASGGSMSRGARVLGVGPKWIPNVLRLASKKGIQHVHATRLPDYRGRRRFDARSGRGSSRPERACDSSS